MNSKLGTDIDIAGLISTWISIYEVGSDLDDETSNEAWRTLHSICDSQPVLAWRIIQDFVGRELSPPVLANFAAGPLENFIAKHGVAYIEEIESFAASDQRFGDALHGVWQNATPDHIWERVAIARDTIRCPCCRSKGLTEPAAYEVCAVCGWEDSPTQVEDPEAVGGGYHESLDQARRRWAQVQRVDSPRL